MQSLNLHDPDNDEVEGAGSGVQSPTESGDEGGGGAK